MSSPESALSWLTYLTHSRLLCIHRDKETHIHYVLMPCTHPQPSTLPTMTPTFCFFAYYGGLTYNAWMNFSKCGVQSHTSIHTPALAGWVAGRYGHKPTGTDTWSLLDYTTTHAGMHTENVCTHKHAFAYRNQTPMVQQRERCRIQTKASINPPDPSKIE